MLLLHISDIHFRSPDCLTPDSDPEQSYRTRLVKDVREQVEKLGAVEAILIGGDIAFKAAPEEYTAAMTWIQELAAASGCPVERVFVVPGNHDVDRTLITRSLSTRNAHAAIKAAPEHRRERAFREHIFDADTAKALLTPLAAYNEFAKLLNCQVFLPDRLYWKQDLPLEDDVTLRIHGLTSIILSGADGQDDTRDSLYLSPLQTVLDPVDDVVNLVLIHHPPDWLMDQDDANDEICGKAQIHMFGHKHRQRHLRDPQFIRFSAGAVNPERNQPGWIPGYNLVEVNVTGAGPTRQLKIVAHLRQWQSNPDKFRAVESDQNEPHISHTIRIPGKERVASGQYSEPSQLVPCLAEPALDGDGSPTRAAGGEAAMGDANTRNLVFRFWQLKSSERREIALNLELITAAELTDPEPERYGRALIRASERGKLEELAIAVMQKERQ